MPAYPGINPARRYQTVGVSKSEAEKIFLRMIRSPLYSPDPAPHGFGDYRGIHEIEDSWEGLHRWHASMDAENAAGLAIHPLAPGMVVFTGWTGMGNTVVIEHDIFGVEIYSIYGHLGTERGDESVLVDTGILVNYSTIIGLTGNTKPNANIDPHLHFEARFSNNINLSNPKNVLAGTRYWAFESENWRNFFVDLGKRWGYDPDNFGNP